MPGGGHREDALRTECLVAPRAQRRGPVCGVCGILDEGLEAWLVARLRGAALQLERATLVLWALGRGEAEERAVVRVGGDVVSAEEGLAGAADGEKVIEIAGRERAAGAEKAQERVDENTPRPVIRAPIQTAHQPDSPDKQGTDPRRPGQKENPNNEGWSDELDRSEGGMSSGANATFVVASSLSSLSWSMADR